MTSTGNPAERDSGLRGYLAFPGLLDELRNELLLSGHAASEFEIHGELVIVRGLLEAPIWSRNTWKSVERLSFQSISDATRKLKALGLRWALYPHQHHRRAQLIAEGLNTPRSALLKFPEVLVLPEPLPKKALGSWMMVTENEILASVHCSQTIANGDVLFDEDRETAPTRAYLKLWEAFTRLGRAPESGEHCIDLGSCPGGWTWVIASLGAQVVSVDRSELEAKIAALPQVKFIQGNAFTLDPRQFKRMDWIFSDVICAPEKLLELVHHWMTIHPLAHYVCTIKFKGETDYPTMKKFLEIPDSSIMHLTHNKHEVTWVRLSPRV
ncbi:MAG: hypothetical protein H7222_13115 [Methylotenera sp.]|nr:hypothetical protein [Oligoflexia bacterium]